MKRFFSLLTLLVAVVTMGGYVHAENVYTLSYKNPTTNKTEETQSSSKYFTCSSSLVAEGGTYNGITYDKGLKMDGTGSIVFTSTSKSNITIIQSLGAKSSSAKLKFDGNYIDYDKNSTKDETNGVIIIEMNDIAAGEHNIKKGTGQASILYVKVEYTGSSLAQLTKPVIDFNNETGSVTISQAEKKDVYYTIDGTTPSMKSTKYETPFSVVDGTTINAIAIGDGTTTIDSKVATCYALLKTVTIQKPVIIQSNGTFAITCATPKTTFEYSIDNGETFKPYNCAVTLLEDATVIAKAKRDNCNPVEGDVTKITAVKKSAKAKTILFYWDDNKFDVIDKGQKLVGKDGTDYEGYTFEIIGKTFSSLTKSITVDSKDYMAIKGSNGAENILHLPNGVKATRMTIYSILNANKKDVSTVCGWKNVNGVIDYVSYPMGAFKDETDYLKNPDIRVYPLNTTGQISFTNAGTQMAFAIALDVVTEENITISAAKMATYSNTSAWEVPEGMEVYTATYADGKVKLNQVTEKVIPANTGVVISGEAKTYTANLTTTTETSLSGNDLKSTAEGAYTATDNTTYVLAVSKTDGKVCFGRLAVDNVVAQGKAYLTIPASDAAKQISIDFSGTTGINAVENANETADGAYYTLSGQRTVKPVKGVYIHNGKKYIAK